MLLLLRGRDKAAAAEEEEAFEGGPSRARHRVGRNSGPFNRTISSTCWCCLQVCRTSPFNRTISSTCWCCLQKHAKSISRMGRSYQMVCGNRYWKAWRLFKRTWERSLVTLLCHFFYLFVPVLLGYSRKGTIQFFMKEYDKALEMYQEGLKHESRNQELLDGAGRCVEQINKASCGDLSPKELKEREVKAIQDPEIQSILTDPVMSQVLIDFDENPKAALEHAKNPVVMNKKCQGCGCSKKQKIGILVGRIGMIIQQLWQLVWLMELQRLFSAPLCPLVLQDQNWIRSDKREDDLGSHPGGIVQKYAANGGLEFFLIVNMQIPGSTTYGLALYFMTKTPLEETPILERFVNGDDAYRNSRFKLIPYISKGSWIVKQSVGKKACLVDQALEVKYNRGKNYLELGINVGSTTVARG